MIGLPGDGAAHHIDNAQGWDALFLCLPECRQTVGGFAGLADDDHQVVLPQQGLAVAEFRGQLHPDPDLRQILQHILGSHAHMVGRAAGNDVDGVQRSNVRFLKADA